MSRSLLIDTSAKGLNALDNHEITELARFEAVCSECNRVYHTETPHVCDTSRKNLNSTIRKEHRA